MSSLESRLAQLERRVGRLVAGDGTRRAFSHAQLIVIARYLDERGELPVERWSDVVGPPEQVLDPGQPSHAELFLATVRARAVCDAAKAEGRELPWRPVFQGCLEQIVGSEG